MLCVYLQTFEAAHLLEEEEVIDLLDFNKGEKREHISIFKKTIMMLVVLLNYL